MVLGCVCLMVDALPSPLPNPDPEPFFGLGLLGRLLAAYSSGDKEDDKGNCKCTSRTFHTKEKDKDKVGLSLGLESDECVGDVQDCPCDSYGAPVGYNAPTNSYEPIDSYGTNECYYWRSFRYSESIKGSPLAPVYGAPDACDCDCNKRTFHTKEKEKDKKCNCDCYSSGYGAPSYDYQPPQVGYTSPVDSYGAPVQVRSTRYHSPSPSHFTGALSDKECQQQQVVGLGREL